MTLRQHRRKERWLKSLEDTYNTGAAEGFEFYGEGGSCPQPLKCDYDYGFYFRHTLRIAQRVTNEAIARSRGRYEGWVWAAKQYDNAFREEWIATQAAEVIAGCESLLRQAA